MVSIDVAYAISIRGSLVMAKRSGGWWRWCLTWVPMGARSAFHNKSWQETSGKRGWEHATNTLK
jgi:hypothetical protein